jgi:Holliday junction resolvasome RuvABC endonuclease subunit
MNMGIIDELKSAVTGLRDAAVAQIQSQINTTTGAEERFAGKENADAVHTGAAARKYPGWKKAWTGTIRTRTHRRK